MSAPHVIILNGKPCTGKSYFLQKLSTDLGLTYITRDELKELLFDDLGIADQEWSKKLGGASYSLLFNVLEKLLKTKKSFILESNFNPTQHQQKLKAMFEKYGYLSVEVFLETKPSILFERHKKRWESGERHRGHVDNERFDEFEKKLANDILLPLGIGDNIIKVDTSDFEKVDYGSLKKKLLSSIASPLNGLFKRVEAVMIHVPNPKEGLAWYQKAFPEAKLVHLLEFNFDLLVLNGIKIEIVQADEKVGAGTYGLAVDWEVESFDQAYNHLTSLGATLYRGPMNIEEGYRMCKLKDPFGNLLGLRGP